MDRQQLKAELARAVADLEDLEELWRSFAGQTGVHIGGKLREGVRRETEGEEARLRERIAELQRLLHEDGDEADNDG